MKSIFYKIVSSLGFALVRLVLKRTLTQSDSAKTSVILDKISDLGNLIFNVTGCPNMIINIGGPEVDDLLNFLDQLKEQKKLLAKKHTGNDSSNTNT